jgi:hypothetical protein
MTDDPILDELHRLKAKVDRREELTTAESDFVAQVTADSIVQLFLVHTGVLTFADRQQTREKLQKDIERKRVCGAVLAECNPNLPKHRPN